MLQLIRLRLPSLLWIYKTTSYHHPLVALLGVAMKVVDELLKYAIPACRKAGIPIVWLNWGLTEQDINEMPPTIVKGFAADSNFDGPRRIEGLGSDIGSLQLEDGSVVQGGRVLMRDQWNSASYAPLEAKHQPQDIWIHKNRLSGFWGGTESEEVLASRRIRTLLFSGANTDQRVGGSLQDAFTKGWDCLLLSDGCATSSPNFAKQCIEYNCQEGGDSCYPVKILLKVSIICRLHLTVKILQGYQHSPKSFGPNEQNFVTLLCTNTSGSRQEYSFFYYTVAVSAFFRGQPRNDEWKAFVSLGFVYKRPPCK
jgi:nicotinamidase-related amidase